MLSSPNIWIAILDGYFISIIFRLLSIFITNSPHIAKVINELYSSSLRAQTGQRALQQFSNGVNSSGGH